MHHTISVLVENKFGVLARISTLFATRGFNIDSLTVCETEDTAISSMTIVVKCDDRILEQIIKQLNKLIDVSQSSVIVEVSGSEDKINAFVRKVVPYGIKEMCRMGVIALCRGQSVIESK